MGDEGDGDEDARLILTRRQLLIASALSGAGLASAAAAQPGPCLSRPVQPALTFSRAPGRRNTPLERVPEVVRGQLQHAGIYAAGGGLTSRPWRIVLGLLGDLEAGEGEEEGGASYGPLPIRWSARLPNAEVDAIVAIADRTWREARAPNLHPTADYDEVLAMRDGADVFFLQGFGPVRGGAAAELIAALRRAADARRPARP